MIGVVAQRAAEARQEADNLAGPKRVLALKGPARPSPASRLSGYTELLSRDAALKFL
jgi:hypothetical protein